MTNVLTGSLISSGYLLNKKKNNRNNENIDNLFKEPSTQFSYSSDIYRTSKDLEYNLSKKRGLVKRIDYGTFINSSVKSDSQDVKFILTGNLLNGILSITGNLCRLTQYN